MKLPISILVGNTNQNMAAVFAILTSGCKVNQYESQAIRESFLRNGAEETDDPSKADFVVLNTCAVTGNAVADARQAVSRLLRIKPDIHLLVTGCAAEAAQYPSNTIILPQNRKAELLNLSWLHRHGIMQEESESLHNADGDTELEEFPPFFITAFRRARPVLKVQDGCSRQCAYCIVPLMRGSARSRSAHACLAEAERLLHAGYREIVISGINVHQYKDPDGVCAHFWELLHLLDTSLAPEWGGVARFRLSSLEPGHLDKDGLACLAESRMLCPHLHLSLQSGSPAVLRAMRRNPMPPEQILERVQAAGQYLAHGGRFGLGADILTGFPGETEEYFQETLDLVSALPLTYAHVFPFSSRPGTAAAAFPDQIDPSIRQERAARVREIAEKKRMAFLQTSLQADSLQIAPEGNGKGMDEAYVSCCFAVPPAGKTHDLVAAKPFRIEKKSLIVQPLVHKNS